jgi:hypothetical protein
MPPWETSGAKLLTLRSVVMIFMNSSNPKYSAEHMRRAVAFERQLYGADLADEISVHDIELRIKNSKPYHTIIYDKETTHAQCFVLLVDKEYYLSIQDKEAPFILINDHLLPDSPQAIFHFQMDIMTPPKIKKKLFLFYKDIAKFFPSVEVFAGQAYNDVEYEFLMENGFKHLSTNIGWVITEKRLK